MGQRNYLLEALSSYFVNDYFTHVYNAAKSDRKGSLTEAYQEKVTNYIRGIKSVERIYRKLCVDIHRYITKSARFSSMMYGEFVDKLVYIFTPEDYYEILTREQREEIFSSIINDLSATLGSFCLRPSILRKIIDEHETAKHVTQDSLFNESLNILHNKRENLMHTYVKSISQSKDMISPEVAEKYRDQIKVLTDDNNNLKSIISDLENDLERAEDEFTQKEYKYKELIDLLTERLKKPKPKPKPEPKPKCESPSVVLPLTENNLKRHTYKKEKDVALKDESESSNSGEIIGSMVRKVLTATQVEDNSEYLADNKSADTVADEESLNSGKKSLVDNIDDLLLIDQYSE